MAIYMDYNSKTPKGNVTAKGFEDQIELHSIQWGVGRSISMTTGAGQNREASDATFSEVTITKPMDKASSGLFEEATWGVEGRTVVISCTKTGAGQQDVYVEYTLENCLISSYSISTSGDLPSESVTLSYGAMLMNFVDAAVSNKDGDQNRTGYNISLAEKS